MRRALLALVMVLASAMPVRAETGVRVAVPALPPGQGNPYTLAFTPGVYTWEAVFDKLTGFDAEGDLVPRLALSWEQVEPRRWRFRLRGSVFFHDGSMLSAGDVVHSIRTVLNDPASAAITTGIWKLQGAEAVDPLTVDILTSSPNLHLPRELSGVYITPRGAWERLGREDFARAPVGTGPFAVTAWEPGRVVLSRAAQAWRPASVDRLELVQMPETAARLQALLSGQLDVAIDLGPDDAPLVESRGGRMDRDSLGAVFALVFLLEQNPDSPLADVRVRRALNHAVDVEAIIAALLGGASVRAGQTAVRESVGHDPALEPFAHDDALARALLAEAGYPDGFAFTLTAAIGAGANDAAVFQAVASELAGVGVEMEIRTVPVATLTRLAFEGGWQAQAFGMTYGTMPGLDALRPFGLHGCGWVTPWFCDPAIDALVEEARQAGATDLRRQRTQAALAAMREAVPALFLYEGFALHGLGPDVGAFQSDFAHIRYDLLEIEGR